MSLPPGVGRRLPPAPYSEAGPLPAAHVDVSNVHLSGVSGPPAQPNRAPGVPMAGPTALPAPGGLNSGPNQPAQRVPGPPRQGGGRKPAGGPTGRAGGLGGGSIK